MGLSRADLFKKLCDETKPTKILALGDVGEFDAASSFDLDKPGVRDYHLAGYPLILAQ
jgi:hypothetical protein